ncbi:hypothetical protein AAET80_001788 [Campylobacter coli]
MDHFVNASLFNGYAWESVSSHALELEEGFVPDVVGRLTIRSANGMRIKFSKREP